MDKVYDLIIIGGGSAGMSASEFAAAFPKKVALVSENIGGECLFTGCVPSKALIYAAKNGWDFSKAVEFVHDSIKAIQNEHDNPEFFQNLGIDVYLKKAEFLDSHSIKIGDQNLKAKYFLIATGSKPLIMSVPGLEKIDYFTNETIFDIKKLPKSLAVIGGGPIGCEMAQAFQRLGSKVTIIQKGDRLLPKDELEASSLILKVLGGEGVRVCLDYEILSVSQKSSGIEIETEHQLKKENINVESCLLIATGRTPNIGGLSLEKIGIKFDKKGIGHNKILQTNLSHIYVAGDVAGDFQFTHFAGVQAVAAVRNIFIPIKTAFSPKVVPWATFTDPEVAHAGLLEEEAKKMNLKYRVVNLALKNVDRAVTENSKEGFIKLLIDKKDQLLGVTIVAQKASEMIHELILAMENNIPVSKILSMIHIYPSYSSGIQQALFKDLMEYGSFKLSLGRIFSKLT